MMWRDFAIALSLSNLYFIGEWRWLLIPSHSFYYYHYKVVPPPGVYLALVLDVLLMAVLFFIVARIVRRSSSHRIKKYARVVFVLTVSVPLYGVLSQLDSHGMRKLLQPFLRDEVMTQHLLFTIPLTASLFVTLISLLKIRKAVKLAVTLILILVPFVFVTFSQTVFLAMKYGRNERSYLAPPVARDGPPKGPRVLWLVFDELDFRMAFSERPSSVEFKELDRLTGESLFATNAFPPAQETFLSIPALTTGNLVSDARRIGPEELMLKFGDDAEAVPWSTQPDIFSRARALGFETALVGWYHPYCRVLGSRLTRCAWEGRVPLSRLQVENEERPPGGLTAIIFNMYAYARHASLSMPLIVSAFPEKPDIGPLVRKKQVTDFNVIYRETMEAAVDSGLGLVMIHWPIPHPPNIYDRFEHKVSTASGRSYLDNLALVDRTVGDLRRAMERNGIWDNTVVLVTSDHWWRSSYWKKQSGWMPEDEAAFRVDTDRRIPFILKMAGGVKGQAYSQPFNTVLTHDLLLAILRGEVGDTKGVAVWLDLHRTIGRSPYDERNSTDGL